MRTSRPGGRLRATPPTQQVQKSYGIYNNSYPTSSPIPYNRSLRDPRERPVNSRTVLRATLRLEIQQDGNRRKHGLLADQPQRRKIAQRNNGRSLQARREHVPARNPQLHWSQIHRRILETSNQPRRDRRPAKAGNTERWPLRNTNRPQRQRIRTVPIIQQHVAPTLPRTTKILFFFSHQGDTLDPGLWTPKNGTRRQFSISPFQGRSEVPIGQLRQPSWLPQNLLLADHEVLSADSHSSKPEIP